MSEAGIIVSIMSKWRYRFLALKFFVVRVGIRGLLVVWPPLAYRWLYRVFTTPIRTQASEPQQQWMEQTYQQQILVDGEWVQLYLQGHGPTVLFSHGWQGRGAQFRRLAEALVGQGYRVIAWDMPAHGASTGVSTTPIHALQAVFKIHQMYGPFEAMVCHSVGGVYSYIGASKGVEVKKMVLIGTPSRFQSIVRSFFNEVLGFEPRVGPLRRMVKQRTGVPVETLFPLHVQPQRDDLDLLLIHDEEDLRVPIEEAHLMQRSHPKAEVMYTQGLGHNRILKDPEVIERVCRWIGLDRT